MAKIAKRSQGRTKPLRALFTCIGRRVELIQAFRRSAKKLGVALEIHGADSNPLSPASYHVDQAHHVPPLVDPSYRNKLLKIVKAQKIEFLVPLIDSELHLVAELAPRLMKLGCRPWISSAAVISTCRDKLATFQTLTDAGIDTPDTTSWRQAMKRKRHRFPYYLKPRFGSAGVGNYVIHNREELAAFGRTVKDAIVQEFVEGIEHTLDVYTGLDGKPRCVVPRRRLEVRAGEVSKGIVVKDQAIMAVGSRVAEVLKGCRGVITVQCMLAPNGRICVIEINARLGGGAPLAIHAGADFPRWMIMEHLGRRPRISSEAYRDNIAMLRYDESVFVENAAKLVDP